MTSIKRFSSRRNRLGQSFLGLCLKKGAVQDKHVWENMT